MSNNQAENNVINDEDGNNLNNRINYNPNFNDNNNNAYKISGLNDNNKNVRQQKIREILKYNDNKNEKIENINYEKENGQHNDTNIVVQSQKNAFIKTLFTPNRDIEVKINMRQNAIWKGFPLSDRFFYTLCCGAKFVTDNKSQKFLIDEMIEDKCILDERIDFSDKYLSIKIIKTGTFDIEPCIIHPFVRFSIVNLKTGKYLQKQTFEIPAILQNEKNLILSFKTTENVLEFRESNLDFIAPMSTAPSDLRIKGESYAEWNEELIINDAAQNIFQSETIFFFEIMDFNLFPNVYSSMREYSTEEFIFPIAWGYLKPVGYSQTYLGKQKIQLYKYKYKRTDMMKKLKLTNNTFQRTPDVLFEFNWFQKVKYQTYLEVEINIDKRPSPNDLFSKEFFFRKYKNSVFLSETEVNFRSFELGKLDNNLFSRYKSRVNDEINQKERERRLILAKRRRGPGEQCILPDKLLFKFETSELGSLTQEFSYNGKYLAVSCTEKSSISTIKIFNVEEGKLSFHLKGHINLIHNFSWSLDNQILVSCGSDNNVIIWQIPQDDSNNSENFDYMDNEKVFKLANITHPSYVYTTAILPEESKDMIILATGCFDGIVRIYTINFILENIGNENMNSPNSKNFNKGNNSPKNLLNSGSNFYKSMNSNPLSQHNKYHILKKTFAKYSILAEIVINEEFLNQDFFFSKSNIINNEDNLGNSNSKGFTDAKAPPLSQTQFYEKEKLKTAKSKFMETNQKNNWKESGSNSNYKNSLHLDKRTEEYLKRMNIKKEDFMDLNDTEKTNLIEKTVLEHRHPNSIFFDELGKLFIGDSLGAIHIWEFRIINAKPICNKIRVITHKEIEGDDINKLYLESGPKRRLVVHSRDNCIRLLDISNEKPRIIVRYFGLKSSKMNIKSCVSPDGNYILSGSEDGKFYLWSLFSGSQISNFKYECDIVDPIIDVKWNNYYNMFSVCGFGRNYPLLIYVHERKELGLDQIQYKLKGEEELMMKRYDDNHNIGFKANYPYDMNNPLEYRKREKENIISAYKDNFSDFSKEYKAIIEPQIKN